MVPISRHADTTGTITSIHVCVRMRANACRQACVSAYAPLRYAPRTQHSNPCPRPLGRTFLEPCLGRVRAGTLAGFALLDLGLGAEHRLRNDWLPVFVSLAARARPHLDVLRPRVGDHEPEDGRGRKNLEDDAPDVAALELSGARRMRARTSASGPRRMRAHTASHGRKSAHGLCGGQHASQAVEGKEQRDGGCACAPARPDTVPAPARCPPHARRTRRCTSRPAEPTPWTFDKGASAGNKREPVLYVQVLCTRRRATPRKSIITSFQQKNFGIRKSWTIAPAQKNEGGRRHPARAVLAR